MPPYDRVLGPVLLALAACCGDGNEGPKEPRATFVLKDGWVEVQLTQQGKPLANAFIQITDDKGVPFGKGETGAEGRTAFPLPPGASFIVDITAAHRTGDPIRLFPTKAGVEPGHVLLSYGLQPCCRAIKLRGDGMARDIAQQSGPGEDMPPWPILGPVLLGLFTATVVFCVAWLRHGSSQAPTSRK